MSTRIVWNSEADAKARKAIIFIQCMVTNQHPQLFCGLLAQLKDTNIKIDYEALAKYMSPGIEGNLIKQSLPKVLIIPPDCVVGAVYNRIRKLRAKVEGTATDTNDSENIAASESVRSTPAASPSVKRKKAGTPRTARSKKAKGESMAEETSPKAKVNPAQQDTSPKKLGQAPLRNEEAISGQETAVNSEQCEDEPAVEA